MGIQGNYNSFFTCYLKVVLDRFFENLEFVLDYSISHYFGSYLSNMINNLKTKDEWKIQLSIIISFMSSKDTTETRIMHTWSDNITGNETD